MICFWEFPHERQTWRTYRMLKYIIINVKIQTVTRTICILYSVVNGIRHFEWCVNVFVRFSVVLRTINAKNIVHNRRTRKIIFDHVRCPILIGHFYFIDVRYDHSIYRIIGNINLLIVNVKLAFFRCCKLEDHKKI